MKIGNREYIIERTECWIEIRDSITPKNNFVIEIRTSLTSTYWIIPIELLNLEKILQNPFDSEFELGKIMDMDTTLLEKDESVNIWFQKINSESSSFFNLTYVEINGTTEEKEKVKANIKTQIFGFEIWKTMNYQKQVLDLELKLKKLSISFQTIDEKENDIIRISIKK